MRGTRNGRGGFGSKRKTDFLWKEHGDHYDGNDDDDGGKNMVIIVMVKIYGDDVFVCIVYFL